MMGLLHKDIATKLAVDGNGNVFVTGNSLQSSTFDFDYATIKYDANGQELCVARYNGRGNNYDVPHDLKLDLKGNVVVTGESDGSDGMREYTTIKYSNDGQEIWVARYDGPDKTGSVPSAMAIDNEGNVYVTGRSGNLPNGDDYATVKYNGNGQQLWAVRYRGTGSGLNEASAIFVDNTGNTYVTGSCTLGDRQHATFDTVKYDQNGNEMWVAKYSQVYFTDRPVGLKVDTGGNVFVTGPVSYFSK